MSRDSAFHGTPHLIAAATLTEDRMLSSVPRPTDSMSILSEISLRWCRRVTFEVFVAEMPRGYGNIAYLFSGGRILHT